MDATLREGLEYALALGLFSAQEHVWQAGGQDDADGAGKDQEG